VCVCVCVCVCDPKCCVCSPPNLGPNDRSPHFEKRVNVVKLEHNARVMTVVGQDFGILWEGGVRGWRKVHGEGPSWGVLLGSDGRLM
jgi:hypothetical protein